ncbi:MAG: N-acylneuraminate-9-phosphate synthase [Nitrosopumilaceae archaeon]|nr:N-acylneuraminate-9-phosphate synthase [Nitrosopumilaceae archaeon]
MKSTHVFVIAEAGSNWKAGSYNQDIKRAKTLIEIAAESGADAVKFQTFRANAVYVPNAGKSDYLGKSGIKNSINEIFENSEMPYEMLGELADHCKKQNIEFMSSVFSVDDARQINKYVKIHKIASYEINHVRLLEYLASTKKPIILSTGASNYGDIDFAVRLLRKNHVRKLSLLQCTAKYPAPIDSLNLLSIPEMEKKYNLPIGLSDHSVDPIIAPVTAVGLGARIIEKHFTINKKLVGPDHKFALEPKELKEMISAIRSAERAFGDGKKRVLNVELELRKFAVRKIQAIADIKKGDRLVEGYNIDVLRPGKRINGSEARFLTKINGKRACRAIKMSDGVTLKDVY